MQNRLNKTVGLVITIVTVVVSVGFGDSSAKEVTSHTPTSANVFDVNDVEMGKLLGWIEDGSAPNLCGGYFRESKLITKAPKLNSYRHVPIKITAQNPSLIVEDGASVLRGDVTITQPGREIVTDKATFWRDEKTGKISTSRLVGNISIREYGKMILGSDGEMDLNKNITTLHNALYRIETPIVSAPLGCVTCNARKAFLSVWGRAKKIMRDAKGILHLYDASYTTCPPTNKSWHLWGSSVSLDKEKGWGSAKNMLLYVHNVPVLYLPYLSFPLDNRRKSGFLYPTFEYSSDGGMAMGLPYYINLAPNYDATITPHFYSERGFLVEAGLRYLTKLSKGWLQVGGILDDKGFEKFRSENLPKYPDSHYKDRLRDANKQRGFIYYRDQTNFTHHWAGDLILNHVSDDYWLHDFNIMSHDGEDDQLLNQVALRYNDYHWHLMARAQAFQSLHPISQSQLKDNSQYKRLPQIVVDGEYPDAKFGFDYGIKSEFVHFAHSDDFNTGEAVVTGSRVALLPSISLPLNWAGAYFSPKFSVQAVDYSLDDQDVGKSDRIGNAIPIFSLDSGLKFNRETHFWGHDYNQTLEPRLFYLYVPSRNQDDIPLFDTTLPEFSLDQLFRENRFSGVDRIGDANQIAFAVTTRFLDDYTGDEKMHLSVGQAYQFHKHEVCLNDKCDFDPLTKNRLSPLIGELQYNVNKRWGLTADSVWDAVKRDFVSYSAGLKYQKSVGKVFNLKYNFLRDGDPFSGKTKDLQRLDLSFEWPIKERWNFIADYNYNISYSHPETYLFGIEYQSCCWALRFVESRTFLGLNAGGGDQFDDKLYLQIVLKGLGGVGSNTGGFLAGRVAGFKDHFGDQTII